MNRAEITGLTDVFASKFLPYNIRIILLHLHRRCALPHSAFDISAYENKSRVVKS